MATTLTLEEKVDVLLNEMNLPDWLGARYHVYYAGERHFQSDRSESTLLVNYLVENKLARHIDDDNWSVETTSFGSQIARSGGWVAHQNRLQAQNEADDRIKQEAHDFAKESVILSRKASNAAVWSFWVAFGSFIVAGGAFAYQYFDSSSKDERIKALELKIEQLQKLPTQLQTTPLTPKTIVDTVEQQK